MKTVMQEVYDNFNTMSDADFKSWMLNTDLIEKEKEVIIDAYNYGQQIPPFNYAEKYYNETFNNKED